MEVGNWDVIEVLKGIAYFMPGKERFHALGLSFVGQKTIKN